MRRLIDTLLTVTLLIYLPCLRKVNNYITQSLFDIWLSIQEALRQPHSSIEVVSTTTSIHLIECLSHKKNELPR